MCVNLCWFHGSSVLHLTLWFCIWVQNRLNVDAGLSVFHVSSTDPPTSGTTYRRNERERVEGEGQLSVFSLQKPDWQHDERLTPSLSLSDTPGAFPDVAAVGVDQRRLTSFYIQSHWNVQELVRSRQKECWDKPNVWTFPGFVSGFQIVSVCVGLFHRSATAESPTERQTGGPGYVLMTSRSTWWATVAAGL